MLDPVSSWARWASASTSLTDTTVRMFDTVAAANFVVAARTEIIEHAMRSPFTGDYLELSRMVAEKADVFSRIGLTMITAWWSAQTAWMGYFHYARGIALRGGPTTFLELYNLGAKTAAMSLGSLEAGSRLAAATVTPIQRKTRANARRLKQKSTSVGAHRNLAH